MRISRGGLHLLDQAVVLVYTVALGCRGAVVDFHSKVHWLPLLFWCISGSPSPVLFLMELGMEIKVSSMIVPCLMVVLRRFRWATQTTPARHGFREQRRIGILFS